MLSQSKNSVVLAEFAMGSKFYYYECKTFYAIHWQICGNGISHLLCLK